MPRTIVNKYSIIIFLLVFSFTCSYSYEKKSVESSALDASKKEKLLEVKINQLVVDPTSGQPVVSLMDSREERALLIWIDFFEARAIYSELQGVKHFRPLTHDLLESIIQKVNGKVRHIIISHIKENTYYATLVIEKEGRLVEIDARPSDSIVMALKFNSTIYVAKTLFETMSVPLGDRKTIEEAYGLKLQELSAELSTYLSFESGKGVLVSGVQNGSQADEDGIKEGDIIVSVGDQDIENVISMQDALAKNKSSIKAKIFRKSQFITITLHLN
ncbi:MAG: DUF151 domain-containing protein [Desulfobacterales bacterium]